MRRMMLIGDPSAHLGVIDSKMPGISALAIAGGAGWDVTHTIGVRAKKAATKPCPTSFGFSGREAMASSMAPSATALIAPELPRPGMTSIRIPVAA